MGILRHSLPRPPHSGLPKMGCSSSHMCGGGGDGWGGLLHGWSITSAFQPRFWEPFDLIITREKYSVLKRGGANKEICAKKGFLTLKCHFITFFSTKKFEKA